jgi:hypothetical protein
VLNRDKSTGRFISTDGCGRSQAERAIIAVRRRRVAKLYPERTPTEIGAELGWAKPTIDKDVAWLVEHGLVERQRPGPRRKYPEPEERKCAGCDRRFTPPSWAPDQRFHSIPCARANQTTDRVREVARRLKTEQRRRADAQIARLNEAGYLTSRQLAAERKVNEATVSQWIARGLLTAERCMIEGEPHQLIAREERDRFNREEWPRIVERMGPGYPANWGRLPRERWSGRKNRELAAAKGKKVGRRSDLDSAEVEEARELRARDWSNERIARHLTRLRSGPPGVSRHQIQRALGPRRKLRETPRP